MIHRRIYVDTEMGGGEGSRAVANLPRPYLIRLDNDAVLASRVTPARRQRNMRVHNLLFSAIVTLRSIETSSEITPMNMRDGAPMTRKVDRLLRRRMRSGVAEYLTR